MTRGIGLALVLAVCVSGLLPGLAGAERRAFVDPSTGALKAYGFVTRNEPGDVAVAVPDDFSLTPGRWRWTGAAWVPYAPPPAPPTPQAIRLQAARAHVQSLLGDPAVNQGVKDALRAILEAIP